MKKLKLFVLSTAAVALISSCSQDELLSNGEGEGTVTFSVSLPDEGLGSRAFGDGYSATKLQYAVYDGDAEAASLLEEGTANFEENSLSTNISLSLATGKSYKIAFFAHNDKGAYTFSANNKTVTVDYAKMSGEDYSYNVADQDAFYAVYSTGQINGAANHNVTLTRPMAQINWATNDLTNNSVVALYGEEAANLTTSVEIAHVKNVLNLLDGSVAGDVKATFSVETRPSESFHMSGYDYLSVNYILAPAETALVDAVLTPYASGEAKPAVNVTNLPIQANYRTNIYGGLLSSTQGFDISKDPVIGGEHPYPIEQTWQGDVVKPVIPENNTIDIASANEFAGLAKMIQDGDTDFKGVTINLTKDLDLNNIAFTPIGTYPIIGSTGTPFKGTFNGNGHKIVNLKSEHKGTAALFGYVTGPAEISNVTIENAKLEGSRYAGGVVGLLHHGTEAPMNPTIKDVTVRNCEISSSKKCGGITGFFQSNVVIENCKVENCTLTATTEVGGLFGSGTYGGADATRLKDNSVTDCEIYVNGSNLNSAGLLSGGLTAGTTPNDQKVEAYNTNNTATNTRIIATASTSTALKAALASATDGLEIRLGESEFSTKDLTFPRDIALTISGAGADKTVINAEPYPAAADCDLTFNNLMIVTTTMAGTELGFQHINKGTYNNVTFKGEMFNYASESETYNDCTFIPNFDNGTNKYSIWCYGAVKSVFNNCVFNNNKGKGILVYNHGDGHDYDVEVNNCVFNVTSDGETEMTTDKAAIEIHTETFVANTKGTIKIKDTTCPEYYGKGLWQEVNNTTSEPTTYFTIIVDGKTVQQGSRQ